jgi:hypothetical protein
MNTVGGKEFVMIKLAYFLQIISKSLIHDLNLNYKNKYLFFQTINNK